MRGSTVPARYDNACTAATRVAKPTPDCSCNRRDRAVSGTSLGRPRGRGLGCR